MGGRCRPQFLAEQTAQQGDQGNADQGDTTASHELLHTLTLCGGIIAAVAFHEVDRDAFHQKMQRTASCS